MPLINDDRIAAIHERVDPVTLMEQYGGKVVKAGRDFKACCPIHGERSPSFHIYTDQPETPYHCYGCGVRGDVIWLVREREGLGFVEAVEWLERYAGIIPLEDGKAAPKPTAVVCVEGGAVREEDPANIWEAISPVPESALESRPKVYRFKDDDGEWKSAKTVATHVYDDEEGRPLFFVLRCIGLPSGKVRPLSWCRNGVGEEKWRWMYPDAGESGRSMYGRGLLAVHPKWPVCICEGEKAADAANHLLNVQGVVAVGSSGGAWNATKTDWRPLADRKEIWFWPDANDAAGAHYAHSLVGILEVLG